LGVSNPMNISEMDYLVTDFSCGIPKDNVGLHALQISYDLPNAFVRRLVVGVDGGLGAFGTS